MKSFLGDCNKQIDTDGDPDLSLYGIRGCPIKRLDTQVLLDPFEKQLHLPETCLL
jgi:hypothetical protein